MDISCDRLTLMKNLPLPNPGMLCPDSEPTSETLLIQSAKQEATTANLKFKNLGYDQTKD